MVIYFYKGSPCGYFDNDHLTEYNNIKQLTLSCIINSLKDGIKKSVLILECKTILDTLMKKLKKGSSATRHRLNCDVLSKDEMNIWIDNVQALLLLGVLKNDDKNGVMFLKDHGDPIEFNKKVKQIWG